ncbi:hypothetical protein C2W62_10965 [Candidatus Entotheonella serta]|nr:hypothetical protein C2W62_10965 [Candidatus Entotheonella serta]
MGAVASMDEQASAPIDGVDFVPYLESGRSTERAAKRACEGEPNKETRSHALETASLVVSRCYHGEQPVNELDAAYEAIPEAERPQLEAQAQERLIADGVPGFMRIVPPIRDVMVRLWRGELVPVAASG